MIVVPAAIAVTKPVVETVAIVVDEDVQGLVVAAVPLPINCEVAPIQADKVPVIAGPAVTEKVAVVEQPALFKYVIVVVPTVRAVTNPVADTVATFGAEDVQGLVVAAVPLPVS
jgi:pantothenate synthetase